MSAKESCSSSISSEIREYIFRFLSLYRISSMSFLTADLSLSLSHFSGLVVYTFFHGQVAGSLQKKAPLPHRKCMEHPFQSPDGRSGCFVPLCFGPEEGALDCWVEFELALPPLPPRPPRPPRPLPPRNPRPLDTAATSAVAYGIAG